MLAQFRRRVLFRWRIAPILALTMVVLTVTFITIVTILDVSRTRRIYWDELSDRGWLLAGQLNVQLADPLYLNNIEDIQKIASIVSSQPDIEYVRVYTPDGTVLVDTTLDDFLSLGGSVDGIGSQALVEQRGIEQTRAGVLEIAQPVSIGNQIAGGVQIGLGSALLQQQIRAIIIEHLIQGVILSAIAAGIAYLIAMQFSGPVNELVAASNDMASGQLDTRIHDVPGGELRELAASFNTMAGELQLTIDNLQNSRSRIVGVQEGVRREIAAHLHGRVQTKLLVLRTELQRTRRSSDLTSAMHEDVERLTAQIDDLIEHDISALSRQLYPSILRRGLIPALQSLTDRFAVSIQLNLDISQGFSRLEEQQRDAIDETVKLAGYRITEDALTNVLKHASATAVRVRLDLADAEHFRISVQDNGIGFSVAQSSRGLGLEAMQDYAGAVSGVCTISSTPGQGSTVTADLPIR